MHIKLLINIFALVVLVSQVHCGCDKPTDGTESTDGDVTKFFKNLRCDIKKGADKLSETTKPWVKEAGESAKRFGGTISSTFSDLKNKISGSPANGTAPVESSTAATDSSSTAPVKVTIEDRILLETPPRCREGELLDAQNKCRKTGF